MPEAGHEGVCSDVRPQEGATAPSPATDLLENEIRASQFLAAPVDFAPASHYPNSQTLPVIFEGSLLATLRMNSGTTEEFYSSKAFPDRKVAQPGHGAWN